MSVPHEWHPRRIKRRLEFATSVQNREHTLAGWQWWRSRRSLRERLLYVYKDSVLLDHVLYGMLLRAKLCFRDIDYLRHSMAVLSRPRDVLTKRLADACTRRSPTSVFFYNNIVNLAEVRLLKTSGIRIAVNLCEFHSYDSSFAGSQAELLEALRLCDWYFVTHVQHVAALRAHGVNAIYLPMAYEPRWFFPIPTERPYDILFVGSIDATRRAWLANIAKHFRVTALTGRNEGIEGVNHPTDRLVFNPYQLNALLNRAKIVLGSDDLGFYVEKINAMFPGDRPLRYAERFYLRQRAFWVAGAGRCYVVERHPGIEHHFTDGVNVVLWSDEHELLDKLHHYLRDTDERESVARAAQQLAASQFTTYHRLRHVFDAMDLTSPDPIGNTAP